MQTQEGLGGSCPAPGMLFGSLNPSWYPLQRVRELPSPLPVQAGWPGPALPPPLWVALGFSLPGPQPGSAMPDGTRSPTRAPGCVLGWVVAASPRGTEGSGEEGMRWAL